MKKSFQNEWKLNDSNFSFFDRIKIALFFLNKKNFWTMNKEVSAFEKEMAKYIGTKHAIFVSSGSTANTLIAMYLKDKFFSEYKKNIVFPSTTWTTSIAPFVREGFNPCFIDINLNDFSIDLNQLESYLKKNSETTACIFITSLIGFCPNINKLKEMSAKYKVKIMMDNCENTFGNFENQNISSFFTSTTSTYFGHQLQSVEGGFIFTNDISEYEYFIMARNHGMTRALSNPEKYLNKDVDSRFDFYYIGNNFRNTDINAFIGRLDFKRKDKLKSKRIEIYKFFKNNLKDNIYLPEINKTYEHVPFCLPLIFRNKETKQKVENFCRDNNIETRPIISGNLLKQTCYKKYGDYLNYPNSQKLHDFAFYVGLHYNVSKKNVLSLVNFINQNT